MADIRDFLAQNGLNSYAESSGVQLQNQGVDGNRIVSELQYRDTLYKNLFSQMVGRAPNETELRTIFSQVAPNEGLGTHDTFTQGRLRDLTSQYIGDNFQSAAQDQALQELNSIQGESNRLADLFRTQGNQAISGVESSLMDYQQKLFERLRPNLITSLQAQGLLNTGGFNQAMASEQSDFANEGARQIADLKYQNEQGANAIAFSGAQAPYQYQMNQIQGQLPYMQQQAQGALGNLFQQRIADQNYTNQMALLNRQAQIQSDLNKKPGFLRSMTDNFAGAFGTEMGTGMAKSTHPYGAMEMFRNGGQGIGSIMGGGGGGAGASMMSSKHYKKNISKLSEQEEEALYDRLVEMPLYRWHYKTEENSKTRHLGVITQEAIPEIVEADGEHLSPVDYLGALTLALKVQHRRMSRKAA